MRLFTWNINSVRLRIESVLRFLREAQPDVLCLQETKTPDEFFPLAAIQEAGFPHIHLHGMKGYNGVAILSRKPFAGTTIHHRVGREDCRHISARFDADAYGRAFTLHNLYIPAGGDIPDPEINTKFAHKLDFVSELASWFPTAHDAGEPVIVAGDFNIAPQEHDVWSHRQMLGVVSHTPVEVEALGRFQSSLSFVDTVRSFVPAQQKCYSWWSYRSQDWRASDRGRRLDHIWTTPDLAGGVSGYEVWKDVRDWPSPSDHVPVGILFD